MADKDMAYRKKLITELEKSRNNVQNSLEYVEDSDGLEAIKRVLDEIDMFVKEVDLSENGQGSLSDLKGKILEDDFEKLIEFNKDIMEKCSDVTEATKELQSRLLNKQDLNVKKEFNSVKQHLSNVRNEYKDRLDYIERIESKSES